MIIQKQISVSLAIKKNQILSMKFINIFHNLLYLKFWRFISKETMGCLVNGKRQNFFSWRTFQILITCNSINFQAKILKFYISVKIQKPTIKSEIQISELTYCSRKLNFRGILWCTLQKNMYLYKNMPNLKISMIGELSTKNWLALKIVSVSQCPMKFSFHMVPIFRTKL
jgi:hypothetical protein